MNLGLEKVGHDHGACDYCKHREELIAELGAKLNDPQQCNSGHKDWPLTLWDCPTCVGKIRAEVERLQYGPLISCPWCGEKLEGEIAGAQISHLIRCGDQTRAAVGRVREWADFGHDLAKDMLGALDCEPNAIAFFKEQVEVLRKALTDTGGKCDCMDTNKHCPPNHHHKGPCCVTGKMDT